MKEWTNEWKIEQTNESAQQEQEKEWNDVLMNDWFDE